MDIVSIDIGVVNFAFTIEEVNYADVETVKAKYLAFKRDKTPLFLPNGIPSVYMQSLLIDLYKSGRNILCINRALQEGDKIKAVIALLDDYTQYFLRCKYIVIEQQVKANNMCCILATAVNTYFKVKYPNTLVVDFQSKHKTIMNGCPKEQCKCIQGEVIKFKSLPKIKRKKWAVIQATEVFRARQDPYLDFILNTKAKLDDIADTVLQLQAFKLVGI